MSADPLPSRLAVLLEGVLFYGDPHGLWGPLLEALVPSVHTVFILGDLAEAKRHPEHIDDARATLGTLKDRGINWYTISGDRESETSDICDLLFYELKDQLADGRLIKVKESNVTVAGLGGVVRGRIWDGLSKPRIQSPDELLAKTPPQEIYRQGLPFKKRSTIFPSTVHWLSEQKADVLICHEAPSCHPNGFAFIDELASALDAKLIVHGHHHLPYIDRLNNGVWVRGLGLAEVWRPQAPLSDVQRQLLRSGLKSLEENERAYRYLKDR
ncbi:metallophosphoesterase family protein [Roseivivax isoporae]|uniref:metallophosphoesterase family protein n=1 Tax=Roseivivax isoporae TaxID=591206 RepID=UPI0012EC98FA|nr:metallophosphoesterase family protein [Roseivivax isoporae]